MLGALTQNKVVDISKLKEDEKLKNIKLSINGLSSSNKLIKQLESESFFQAPAALQNALTLDPEKIKNKKLNKNYGLASMLTQAVEHNIVKLMKISGSKKEVRDEALYKEFLAQRKKYGKLSATYNNRWEKEGGPILPEDTDYAWEKSEPKFLGAQDSITGDLSLSDDWNRIENSFSGSYAYKRTNAEIIEMIEHLRIQENKEEWDKIKNDREARAFYESSYKEAARKFLFSQYAGARRLNETVCVKMLAMHPTDLLYQATPELHALILQNSTVTNAFIAKQKEPIRKLFSEDNEGNYSFDADEAYTHTNMSSAGNFKLTYLMTHLCSILACSFDADKEICRKLYGNDNIYESTILPAFREAKTAKDPIAAFIDEGKPSDVAWWYLSKHPEMLDKKILHKKSNGKFVLQHIYNAATVNMLQGGEESFKDGLKKKLVGIPSDKELDAYQEHLTKEGYPKTRTENTVEYDDVDEMVKEEEIEPEKEIKLAGCAEKVLTGEELRKNRREDPYNLNLIRNNLSELTYKDDSGKERVRNIGTGF